MAGHSKDRFWLPPKSRWTLKGELRDPGPPVIRNARAMSTAALARALGVAWHTAKKRRKDMETIGRLFPHARRDPLAPKRWP